jgi:hypothetical protein
MMMDLRVIFVVCRVASTPLFPLVLFLGRLEYGPAVGWTGRAQEFMDQLLGLFLHHGQCPVGASGFLDIVYSHRA